MLCEPPRNLARSSDPTNARLNSERLFHLGTEVDCRIRDGLNLLVEAYAQRLDDRLVEGGRTDGRITNAGKGSNACVDLVLTRAFAGDRFISHRDVLAPSRPVRFSKEESLPLFGLSFEYSW